MAYDIGPKIGIEGEKAFKSAISGINKDMAVLGSELGKVSAQFGTNANSMESLRAKSEVYNKQIEAQKDKINTLRAALENSAKEYGENDNRTKNWQISLNKAEGELAKIETSLKDTTDQMENFGKESDDGGKAIETAGKKAKASGDDAKDGESGWSKLGSRLKNAGKLAAKAALAIGAAALGAATGVAAMTVKAAESADEINTLAKQTGLSTEEIQKFQYASEMIDVPLETLTGSMAKLTKNMQVAKEAKDLGRQLTGSALAFEDLGIAVMGADGEMRSNQDVFDETISKLGEMENETQRDAYAMQIFGKSAQDLNPLILGGVDSLKQLGDEAEAAGLILGQDSLNNLNLLADAMDTFKATLSGSGSLFATAFAGPMAEGMNTLTGYLKDLSGAFKEGGFEGLADKAGEVITDMIGKVNEALPKILEFGLNIITKIIEGITQNIPALIEGATNILMMLVSTLLTLLPQLMTAALEIVKTLAAGIADSLPELIPSIVDTMLTIVDTLIDNIDMLIDSAIAIIIALAEGLIDALPRLIEKVPEIVMKLVEAIVKNAPKLLSAALTLVLTLVSGIIESLPKLGETAADIVTTVVQGVIDLAPELFRVGKDIVFGIWDGIKSLAGWFKRQISDFFSGIVGGIKNILGIHSPSKVFSGIGEYMAEGLGKGFSSAMNGVARDINASVPTKINMSGEYSAAESGGSESGMLAAIASMLGGQSAARQIVEVPLVVDGKTLARVVYDPMQNEARLRGAPLLQGV